MRHRGIVLKLIMDELGVSPSLESFSSRLVLQKGMYLLQKLGLPGQDYTFGWYLRGPYSPALTRAAFEDVVEPLERGEDASGYKLAQAAKGHLARLKSLRDRRPNDLPDDLWLELLASMHFYRHEMYFSGQVPEDKPAAWLYQRLPNSKRRIFTQQQAVSAAEVLASQNIW